MTKISRNFTKFLAQNDRFLTNLFHLYVYLVISNLQKNDQNVIFLWFCNIFTFVRFIGYFKPLKITKNRFFEFITDKNVASKSKFRFHSENVFGGTLWLSRNVYDHDLNYTIVTKNLRSLAKSIRSWARSIRSLAKRERLFAKRIRSFRRFLRKYDLWLVF